MTFMAGLRHKERLAACSACRATCRWPTRPRPSAAPPTPTCRSSRPTARGDPVIAIARAVASRDALRALGYTVDWHEYPMQHSVCAPEIADMNRWLLRVLG